mmetsp:Transcript_23117/g.65498  ORF Transcript_23117/g.65498 Transcript_23117/m.65498 type:complete len:119 (-) Transcript_23117:42-398(-)
MSRHGHGNMRIRSVFDDASDPIPVFVSGGTNSRTRRRNRSVGWFSILIFFHKATNSKTDARLKCFYMGFDEHSTVCLICATATTEESPDNTNHVFQRSFMDEMGTESKMQSFLQYISY